MHNGPLPDKLWTPNYILLTVGSFFLSLSFYLLIPTLPVFLTEALGAPKSYVGWIIATFTLAALLVRPFAGFAIDTWGRKLFLLISVFLFALLFAVHAYIQVFAGFLLIRFLHGLAWGISTTTNSTLAIDIIPPAKRGAGLGYFGLAMPVAMAFGPLVGLYLMHDGNYSLLFYSGLGIAMVSFILLLLINYPVFKPLPRQQLTLERLIEKKALPISLIMLLLMTAYGGIVSFITIYAIENHVGETGLFFMVYAIGLALSRVLAGNIFDKKGPRILAPIGSLLVFVGILVLSLLPTTLGFLVSAAFIGIGFGIIFPVFQAMVNNMVVPNRRGAANSSLFTALDLGIGLGAVLTGYFSDLFGLGTAFIILASTILLATILFPFLALKHYTKHKL
jgi:MFS family permease